MARIAQVLFRRVWRAGLSWRFRLLQRHRHRHLSLERIDGVAFLVLPEVFNPSLFSTSEALCSYLTHVPLSREAKVLDLGTGSGAAAIFAARKGARVLGVDISPEAVRCSRINVLLNRLENQVEIREGDLFTPVKGEVFDLVLFNPPFYGGTPRASWEFAWRSEDILDRFAKELKDVLSPSGRALMIVSSDVRGVEQILDRHGVGHQVVWQQNLVSERLMIHELKMAQPFEDSGERGTGTRVYQTTAERQHNLNGRHAAGTLSS